MTKKARKIFDSPSTHNTVTGKKFPPPLNFNQRLASKLNWYLRMIMGAKSTVTYNYHIMGGAVHFDSLSPEQYAAYNDMAHRADKLRALLEEQAAAIRNFHTLPKKAKKPL